MKGNSGGEHKKDVYTISLTVHWGYICQNWGDRKYEAIERDQYVIETLKLTKGIMFKFKGNKELTHAMWEAYVSVFWCRQ